MLILVNIDALMEYIDNIDNISLCLDLSIFNLDRGIVSNLDIDINLYIEIRTPTIFEF